jgi:dihydroxy-acid dehydratase
VVDFNTIGVSDGMSNGKTECVFIGFSDVITDSIETVVGAQWYDGMIAIPGCDKNMPGALMAMGRLIVQQLWFFMEVLFTQRKGEDLNIVSAFEALGKIQ